MREDTVVTGRETIRELRLAQRTNPLHCPAADHREPGTRPRHCRRWEDYWGAAARSVSRAAAVVRSSTYSFDAIFAGEGTRILKTPVRASAAAQPANASSARPRRRRARQ